MGNILLVANTRLPESAPWYVPRGYTVRPCALTDADALGRLYFDATDARVDSLLEAVADMQRGFDGEYGDYWPEASLLVEYDHATPVAAIQTVHRAPWADTPDCPWVNELFTARGHRRHGLARALLTRTMLVAADAGRERIALRVNDTNVAARTLYDQLGFRRSVGT